MWSRLRLRPRGKGCCFPSGYIAIPRDRRGPRRCDRRSGRFSPPGRSADRIARRGGCAGGGRHETSRAHDLLGQALDLHSSAVADVGAGHADEGEEVAAKMRTQQPSFWSAGAIRAAASDAAGAGTARSDGVSARSAGPFPTGPPRSVAVVVGASWRPGRRVMDDGGCPRPQDRPRGLRRPPPSPSSSCSAPPTGCTCQGLPSRRGGPVPVVVPGCGAPGRSRSGPR